jgi:hypothetical protein
MDMERLSETDCSTGSQPIKVPTRMTWDTTFGSLEVVMDGCIWKLPNWRIAPLSVHVIANNQDYHLPDQANEQGDQREDHAVVDPVRFNSVFR